MAPSNGGTKICFDGGAKVMKELQAFISFVAYDKLYHDGDSMKENEQMKYLFKLYHGDGSDDMVSFVDQCCKGVGPFEGLYEREVNTVTDAATQTTTNSVILQLKPLLHGIESKRIIVADKGGINKRILSSRSLNSPVHLTGRTMLSHGKDVLANCKKALAIVKHVSSPYKNVAETGELPSGMSFEDYCSYVRTQMYKAVGQGAENNRDEDDEGNDELAPETNATETNQMPAEYFFKGYFVFVLLGPFVPQSMETFRSKLLATTDPDCPHDKKKCSRTIMRKQKKENRDAEHANDCSGERGLTVTQRIQLAAVMQTKALVDSRNASRIQDRKIAMANNKIILLNSDIQMQFKIIGQLNITDPEHPLFKNVFQLQSEMKEYKTQLLALEEEALAAQNNQYMSQADKVIEETIGSLILPNAKKLRTTPPLVTLESSSLVGSGKTNDSDASLPEPIDPFDELTNDNIETPLNYRNNIS